MQRYVVSAQRSGLNWFRYCFEAFYGIRTPGKTSLLEKNDHKLSAFRRSHDALNLTRRARARAGGSWQKLDPKAVQGDRILLLLRDPLETYVRMAGKRFERYRSFVSNIRFYHQAGDAIRMVAYYEDLVADPDAMCSAMAFLNLDPADGSTAPTATEVAARWDELGVASRANYDKKQGGSGGAHTKSQPTNFSYHQSGLTEKERKDIWTYLALRLNDSELALLDRYKPDQMPVPGLRDKIRFLRV